MIVEPRGEAHEDDAEDRVDRLPLEVGHGVAVPERGCGRRGAVDHDEAERDEAERDERQDALVEPPVDGG